MWEPHGESERENLRGVVIDDAGARFTGDWANGAWKPVVGSGYRHDGDSSKGEKIASFTLNVAKPGKYKVVLLYVPGDNRSSNTPVKLTIGDLQESFVVNQKVAAAGGKVLGTFNIDKTATLTVSNKDTDGHVIVDGVQLVAVPGS